MNAAYGSLGIVLCMLLMVIIYVVDGIIEKYVGNKD